MKIINRITISIESVVSVFEIGKRVPNMYTSVIERTNNIRKYPEARSIYGV